MHPHGSDNTFGSLRDALPAGKCVAAMHIDNLNWWRGNWWRLNPPAVPFASAWGLDS